jgi:hypothetical protein
MCTSIAFQWYKELFKAMGFDPCNYTLKIWESIWDSNSQHGNSLVSVRVHSLTLFTLSGVCDVTPGSLSWPTTLQPLALVVRPRLGLRQIKSWKIHIHMIHCILDLGGAIILFLILYPWLIINSNAFSPQKNHDLMKWEPMVSCH